MILKPMATAKHTLRSLRALSLMRPSEACLAMVNVVKELNHISIVKTDGDYRGMLRHL